MNPPNQSLHLKGRFGTSAHFFDCNRPCKRIYLEDVLTLCGFFGSVVAEQFSDEIR